jgi:hypothetical protein
MSLPQWLALVRRKVMRPRAGAQLGHVLKIKTVPINKINLYLYNDKSPEEEDGDSRETQCWNVTMTQGVRRGTQTNHHHHQHHHHHHNFTPGARSYGIKAAGSFETSGNTEPIDTAPHPRWPESSAVPLLELQISQLYGYILHYFHRNI